MKKVHIFTHEFYPKRGGAGVVVEELSRAASEIGHPVNVWAPKDTLKMRGPLPFQLDPIPNQGTLNWSCCAKTLKRIKSLGKEFPKSIVHLAEAGSIRACMYGQLRGVLRKVDRLILTFYGSEILNYSKFPLGKILLSKLIRKADTVHLLSNATEKLLQKHFPVPQSKIKILPGAGRSLLPYGNPKLELPDTQGKKICLTVARIHPRKGQHVCLSALASLPRELRKNIEYWIVGPVVNRDYNRRLKEHAGRLDVVVRFWGEVDDADLPPLYDRADAFVMTSVPYRRSVEGFGLVYLEAAQRGVPSIGHKIGGVDEAISDGKSGILCRTYEVAAITAALEKLLFDKPFHDKMSEDARNFASGFSWYSMAEGLYSG
jgi:phosphatidylinositol alpha-1,6-mannosyltransferase